MLSGNLRLMEIQTGRKARVITALRMAKQHLFNYMGYVGAYLLIGLCFLSNLKVYSPILGGVDPTGPHLYECSANGTTMAKPYAAMGSGSYGAISMLEKDFKTDMTVSSRSFWVSIKCFSKKKPRILSSVLSTSVCTETTPPETV